MIPLVEKLPSGLDVEAVECPTCRSFVGWGCAAPTPPGFCSQRADGYHRTRVLAALRHAGRVIRCVRRYVGTKTTFFLDLRERRYYDLVPGYATMYVARVGASP